MTLFQDYIEEIIKSFLLVAQIINLAEYREQYRERENEKFEELLEECLDLTCRMYARYIKELVELEKDES